MFEFLLQFPLSLGPRVQLTKSQHGSYDGLAPNRWRAIIWTNGDLVYWRIYASLGLNELTESAITDAWLSPLMPEICKCWQLLLALFETIGRSDAPGN